MEIGSDNMKRTKKQKMLMIIALIVSIASLSIGFAAFSSTLTISSSASVTPNRDTFEVKFSTNKDSLVVEPVTPSSKTNDITASDGVIDNSSNPTIKNLSATFTIPGQYVEYTFYARNEGEYTAYLNNINFIGNKTCKGAIGTTKSLVDSACESIKISAHVGGNVYTKTNPVTNHSLGINDGEEIVVRLEYESNGTYVDGDFSINFPNIAFVYSTIDDPTMSPTITDGNLIQIVSGDINTPGSEVCISDECFYVISYTDDTVNLLAKYNLYVGNIVENIEGSDEVGYTPIMSPITSPTGKQDSRAVGAQWDSDENPLFPWIGTVAYSNNSTDYNGSIVEGYVNNYKSYLESLGANVLSARLLTDDDQKFLSEYLNDEWTEEIKSILLSSSYWLGIPGIDGVCIAIKHKDIGGVASNDIDTLFGVRPVITISKSEFQKD